MGCRKCKFWVALDTFVGDKLLFGNCHRFPPLKKELKRDDLAQWAESYENDWCGEFKERKTE
jgi:hypothetical protein|tara:strand:+ start:733 stop:918 length:186 start_codon:yes stop_codon:yes gene_type:complete